VPEFCHLSPHQFELPLDHLGELRLCAGSMIRDLIVANAVGPHLVASHTASNLNLPTPGFFRPCDFREVLGDAGFENLSSQDLIAVLALRCGLRLEPCRFVAHDDAAFCLVAMLTAWPAVSCGADLNVLVAKLVVLRLLEFENGDGHRRSVNSSAAFCGRYSLPSMAACFFEEWHDFRAVALDG
jgi:hypothetical protein